MDDNYNGVHIVSRSRGAPPRRRSGAGILIFVLLLLTAGICALVVLLPRLDAIKNNTDSVAFTGKSLYMLSTGESDELSQAQLLATDTAGRGGAGYVFNDGTYRIIAAVYAREADAKLLSGVNSDSTYFELIFPKATGKGDGAALEFFAGEWFDKMSDCASDLERGTVTEAAAEFAVAAVSQKLAALADGCDSGILSRALQSVTEPVSGSRSVLSRIRYMHVRTVAEVYFAACNIG